VNPLQQLHTAGQSFWYDNIRRLALHDGTLARLIADDGLRGMTSNPSIFEKAIIESNDYDAQLAQLSAETDDPMALYEALALDDIRRACDLFAPVHAAGDGVDGYVSLEVAPTLAHDTDGTVAEARRLFAAVNRPNCMIKIPATPAGIPAIRQVLGAGINVNVTLMFNMAHYRTVAQAAIDGLNDLVAAGGNPARVASVASFFISRVDSAVDAALEQIGTPQALALRGQAAIANSKVVYEEFGRIFHGRPFAALAAQGARPQRLLWASTSTKNPAYPDTLYVDQLIGPQTVNTMPPATVDAFRARGTVAHTLEADVTAAHTLLADLAALGIDLPALTEQLQVDGVAAFARSFETLLAAIRTATAIPRS
jgi:transaldolase